MPKADPAPARLFEIIWGFVFLNFDFITRIYFNCSHYSLLTISILFSTLTTKYRVCMKEESKQASDPKNSTPGPRPPVLKFLDPPLYAQRFQREGIFIVSFLVWHERPSLSVSFKWPVHLVAHYTTNSGYWGLCRIAWKLNHMRQPFESYNNVKETYNICQASIKHQSLIVPCKYTYEWWILNLIRVNLLIS